MAAPYSRHAGLCNFHKYLKIGKRTELELGEVSVLIIYL